MGNYERKGAVSGHARTRPTANIFKATQQGGSIGTVRIADPDWSVGYQMGCTLALHANTIEPSACGGNAALCQTTQATRHY